MLESIVTKANVSLDESYKTVYTRYLRQASFRSICDNGRKRHLKQQSSLNVYLQSKKIETSHISKCLRPRSENKYENIPRWPPMEANCSQSFKVPNFCAL